jgi:L-alanine-DL-glutamate epimerase-like enolase superfamily enzyme
VRLRITDVVCHVLVDPDYDVTATSSAQDDLVVEVRTDEGLSGIGESDVNPWIGRECIEAPGTHTMGLGLRDLLLAADPLDVEGLWERLYTSSAMNGRRGAVIHALGALDIALHDLRGKILGQPCHRLLSDREPRPVVPYASLQPETTDFDTYLESMVTWARKAQERGFQAAKVEVTLSGPYAHKGMHEPQARATEVLTAVRAAVGREFTLMCDVQYAFPDAAACLRVIDDWADLDLFFLETPLPSDDLDGYAELAASAPMPIAAGEWLATRFECLDLMDRGKVGVIQPDIGRVGGLTEAVRVADLAAKRNVTVVPHLWKTGLSVAAAVHLASVIPHCPYVEFLPADLSESPLRKELAVGSPEMAAGVLMPSTTPGLGVELNPDALERFSKAARRVRG